ncbi:MAG: sulfite exporter TauE/SafE family protein [Candidatus Omnitrophica bacterium]|nr:sulfite exporter TauE/SafE family protein [Candidatus Omnitrophota bacterium]
MNYLLYVILGLVAGILSGMFGIGGGTILIPALVFLFGLTQHQAQGTTLAAMVPPIGLLAAWRYWQAGNVKISLAVFICLGFLIGGLIGAHFIQGIPEPLLKKLFGVYLLAIALRIIFTK